MRSSYRALVRNHEGMKPLVTCSCVVWICILYFKGRIELNFERRGRRCTQLLDDLKETRGYWKLKEEALDRTLWRTRFGRGYGHVVRQTTEWMNEWMMNNKDVSHSQIWSMHICLGLSRLSNHGIKFIFETWVEREPKTKFGMIWMYIFRHYLCLKINEVQGSKFKISWNMNDILWQADGSVSGREGDG
jgi:hypothetical protein